MVMLFYANKTYVDRETIIIFRHYAPEKNLNVHLCVVLTSFFLKKVFT